MEEVILKWKSPNKGCPLQAFQFASGKRVLNFPLHIFAKTNFIIHFVWGTYQQPGSVRECHSGPAAPEQKQVGVAASGFYSSQSYHC